MDKHFGIEHIRKDIKGLSVRGGAVSAAAQIPAFLLHLVSIVVLSRLLSPEDFGLVAMVAAVTGIIAMFDSMGLSAAVVQNENINHEQASSLFWINAAVGFALFLLTAAVGPLLVWYYERPELLWITFAFAFARILGGMSNQHTGILQRKMRFGALSIIGIVSMTAGVVSAITAAMKGAGYWSLVIMPLVTATANFIGLWVATGWIPCRPRMGTGVRPMLDFGWKLVWSRVIYHMAGQIDYILIGRYCGAAMLGYYTKAYQLLTLPQSKVKAPITSVAISGLSRLRNEPQHYAKYYLKVIKIIAWLTAPLTGMMAAVATDAIVVVLGVKWAAAGPIFKIFAFAAFFRPIHSSVIWIFTSQGRSDRFRVWSIILFLITALSVVVGLPWGVKGVATAHTIAYIFCIMPWSYPYAFKGTSITVKLLLQSISLPLLIGLGLYGTGEIICYCLREAGPIVRLLSSLAGSAALFLAMARFVAPIRSSLVEIVELKDFLHKQNDTEEDA